MFETGLFGYANGRPEHGDDGRYRLDRGRVPESRRGRRDRPRLGLPDGTGCLAREPGGTHGSTGGASERQTGGYPEPGCTAAVRGTPDRGDDPQPSSGDKSGELAISFTAHRDKLFDAWNTLANRADVAGKVNVQLEAKSETALDEARVENGCAGAATRAGVGR